MNEHETRSAERAGVQVDWVGHAVGQGVGDRQGGARPGRRGGGYLNECTPSELWEDAKFRELSDMGLPAFWLRVAREIGLDNFLTLWRMLDKEDSMRSDSDGMVQVQIRPFASYERYQRNRFIESLAAIGLSTQQIRQRVCVELGEELSDRHILRLAARRKVRP